MHFVLPHPVGPDMTTTSCAFSENTCFINVLKAVSCPSVHTLTGMREGHTGCVRGSREPTCGGCTGVCTGGCTGGCTTSVGLGLGLDKITLASTTEGSFAGLSRLHGLGGATLNFGTVLRFPMVPVWSLLFSHDCLVSHPITAFGL